MALAIIGEPTISHTLLGTVVAAGPDLGNNLTTWFNNIGLAASTDIAAMVGAIQLSKVGSFISWDVWLEGGGNGTTTFGGKMAMISSRREADNSITIKVNNYHGTVMFNQPIETIAYEVQCSGGRRYGFAGPKRRWTETRHKQEPRGVNGHEIAWVTDLLRRAMAHKHSLVAQ